MKAKCFRALAGFLLAAIWLTPRTGLAVASEGDPHALFEAADRSLNQVWRSLTRKADSRVITPLRESQRIWISFRDANAVLAATVKAGNLEAAIGQKALDTEWRVDFLKDFFVDRSRRSGESNDSDFETVDRQLEEEYRAALADLPESIGAALRTSQQLWVASREADLGALRTSRAIKSEKEARGFLKEPTERRLAAMRSVRAASAEIARAAPTLPLDPAPLATTAPGNAPKQPEEWEELRRQTIAKALKGLLSEGTPTDAGPRSESANEQALQPEPAHTIYAEPAP